VRVTTDIDVVSGMGKLRGFLKLMRLVPLAMALRISVSEKNLFFGVSHLDPKSHLIRVVEHPVAKHLPNGIKVGKQAAPVIVVSSDHSEH